MAMIAVNLVLEKLASMVMEESKLQTGIRRGIDQLRDDLESMKSFLQDAESRSHTDHILQTWVKQVRDVAYDTEDALDDFFRLSPPFRRHGDILFRSLRNLYRHIMQLKSRRRLALQILDIKAKVKAISERKTAFDLIRADESTTSEEVQWHDPRLASLYLEEAEIVGIENPRSLLISWLIEGRETLTSISVVGMGGLGKTTLVKKAFDNQTVKSHFGCHAWITVSKSFTSLELLRAALKSFLLATKEPVPEELEVMDNTQLVDAIRNYLRERRYVVVFDDVWSISAWGAVRYALPDCNCGSRIIFTTRIGDVARSMELETTGHFYHLQPLPEDEAWTLFCMKAFRGQQHKGICPEHLEAMSRSILKKCGGLPLAIVSIAGLLLKKEKSALEWKKVHDSLAAEMKSDSNLVSLERILLLSYNDLPYHLKSCYLYLSIFPEDYLIKRMKVVRLWAIERFVEERRGLTAEEVAEAYLNELAGRSMVQVVEMDYFNRVKTFRVHDIMREIIQLKSRDESLVMVLDERSRTLHGKVRRISIQNSSDGFPSDMRLPHLRSLLLFLSAASSPSLEIKNNAFMCGSRFLRVLELEAAPVFQFPPELVELIHLRYLSLRRTMIRELPDSIGKLKNLEILDLKGSPVSAMPSGILQLNNLCQLRSYRYHFRLSFLTDTHGFTVPKGICRLTSLQKLGSVEVNGDSEMVRELGKLTQLRRLGVLKLGGQDGLILCSSLEKMKHLTSLYVVSVGMDEFQMDSAISPPKFLQNFYLKCSIKTLPDWIVSLQYLGKLVLQHCNLKDDPLKALGGLPSLTLFEIRQAYHGEELCCETIGYTRLKKLGFYGLSRLKRIRVVEGAMPGLQRLEIVSCGGLEIVPSGIEHLKNLQDLLLWDMPDRFFNLIKHSHGADFWKVQHIPTIKYP